MTNNEKPKPYVKPVMKKHDNLKDITFECANWQCSIVVPTTHPAGP